MWGWAQSENRHRVFPAVPISWRRPRLALFTIGMLVLALLAAVTTVSAQDPVRVVTDDEVNAIAKELFCPICESTPLDVCETQACADWRDVIREKLAEGQSEQEIKDYFVDLYGVRAVAEPPAEGITLPVWLVPIIAIPLAILFFALYMRNIRRSEATAAVASDQTPDVGVDIELEQDPYVTRIERELRDM